MPIFASPFGPETEDERAARFASQLANLLPPGVLWNLDPDSNLRKVFLAVGDELERTEARGWSLIEETDPRTASETLSEWEEMLGLPDDLVTEIPATYPERRVAITQKLVARSGQNYSFFELLCDSCGYPLISITNYADSMLRVGFRVGDRVYGEAYAYAMTVTVGPAGTGALSHAEFERVIRGATHSHIQVMFVYT